MNLSKKSTTLQHNLYEFVCVRSFVHRGFPIFRRGTGVDNLPLLKVEGEGKRETSLCFRAVIETVGWHSKPATSTLNNQPRGSTGHSVTFQESHWFPESQPIPALLVAPHLLGAYSKSALKAYKIFSLGVYVQNHTGMTWGCNAGLFPQRRRTEQTWHACTADDCCQPSLHAAVDKNLRRANVNTVTVNTKIDVQSRESGTHCGLRKSRGIRIILCIFERIIFLLALLQDITIIVTNVYKFSTCVVICFLNCLFRTMCIISHWKKIM